MRISGIFVKGFEGQQGEYDWEQMLWRSFAAGGVLVSVQDQLGKLIMGKSLCSVQRQGSGWVFFKAVHLRVFSSVNLCLMYYLEERYFCEKLR